MLPSFDSQTFLPFEPAFHSCAALGRFSSPSAPALVVCFRFITVRSFLLLTLTGSNRSFCATFPGLRVGLLLSVFDASPQLSGIELPEDFSLALAVL